MDKKVLVVEDEQDIVEYMKDLLTDNGYQVAAASNGKQALEKIREYHPDVILLDIQMPEETGVELYRKMFRDKQLQSIPVIVVSGMSAANWAINSRVPVIDKPIDEAVLLDQIESMVN